MKITSDWHIHTNNSCDGACMTVDTLLMRARELGITDFGISDHLHTPFNLHDVACSRREFLANHPSARIHFGIEVSCVSQWEIDEIAAGRAENPVYGIRTGGPAWGPLAIGIDAEDIENLEIEYVVGGTHWGMYVPVEPEVLMRDYHRQNMFLATHPLVTIVAHPWWWHNAWQDADGMYRSDPWMDDFKRIPESMHDEFAAAARENGKVVEINIQAMLLNPTYPEAFRKQYVEYLAGLKARGVRLSIGSDCHDEHYAINFLKAAEMLDSVGIGESDLWQLEARKGDLKKGWNNA